MLPKQSLTHRGRRVKVTMPVKNPSLFPSVTAYGKVTRYDLDPPNIAVITLNDGTLLLWDEVAGANGSIEFVDDNEIPAVDAASFVVESIEHTGPFSSAFRPASDFEVDIGGKSVALIFHEIGNGVFKCFNAPLAGMNGEFRIGEIPEETSGFTPAEILAAFKVPPETMLPYGKLRPLPATDEPHASHGDVKGVPLIILAEMAIEGLISRMHAMCPLGELSPNVVDKSRDVEFSRGLLGAIARFNEGDSGPFSIEECYQPRDPMRDPRPLDAFVSSGQTIVVVERAQSVLKKHDVVTFCIIDSNRPDYQGRPYCMEKISTVEVDDFGISMSAGRSIEAFTKMPILRWQPIRLAPGCAIDETSGDVAFDSNTPLPDWLAPHAFLTNVVAPVLASGDLGPEREEIVQADLSLAIVRHMNIGFDRLVEALGAHRDSDQFGDHV